ncbi:FliM/FliN family flagellar motor switch protein [Mesorhizobium sp. AaZ16]|jgi:flagellar motor switch protein FliM|uniref:FliM/FliN family flagellar motor switch protein n=1 Tax=Mesorhizobium sp. AaZ16 TaxID=3402289 RepID=UPI00374EFA59
MASPASPAETRAFILERLVGDRGETQHVVEAARGLGARALPILSDNLNAMLASPLTIELGNIDVMRLGDVKPDAAGNQAMTIASSPMSSDALVMLVDPDAIAVVVSALFGGDPDMPVAPIERELSPTEIEVATMMCQEVATSVNGWGARALNIHFPLPTALAGAKRKGKVLRDGPAVRVEFKFTLGPSSGILHLLMPQRVLMHRTGSDAAAGGPAVTDWRQRFSEEVMRSTVSLEATMPLARMTLGDLAAFRVGQVIELEEGAQSEARLSARKKTLFVCEFGKLGQNYTVRIRHQSDAGQEFIDGLMTG